MTLFCNHQIEVFRSQLCTEIHSTYSKFADRDIVIWGAGTYARIMGRLFLQLKIGQIKCFCSSTPKEGDFIHNLPVYSPEQCYKLYPKAVYIIVSDFRGEILKQIAKSSYAGMEVFSVNSQREVFEKQYVYTETSPTETEVIGFKESWIVLFNSLKNCNLLDSMVAECLDNLHDENSKSLVSAFVNLALSGNLEYLKKMWDLAGGVHYFSDEYYQITEDEVYVDCGAYTGDSIRGFLAFAKGHFKKILAFEPDRKNFLALEKNISALPNSQHIRIYNCAVGNKNQDIKFCARNNMSSLIADGQNSSLMKMVKLDDFLDEKISFIKMDIEGAELLALKGARLCIRKYKPKLAICLYHKALDFLEITNYVKELVPEYTVSIRKHSKGIYGTVLYAHL